MSTSFENLQSKSNAVIDAIRRLEEAKESIETDALLAETDSLVAQEEKKRLEGEVNALSQAKQHLEVDVRSAKQVLDQLIRQIADAKTEQAEMVSLPANKNSDENGFLASEEDEMICEVFAVDSDSQETFLETQERFNSQSLVTLETQEDSISVSTSSSISTRRRKVQKASRSPKKWRRMIRSHRLQSILMTS